MALEKKSFDQWAAWDLQQRAEQYLRERRPEGYRMSPAHERQLEPLRQQISCAYELEDTDAHEQAISRMVRLALEEDYASYRRHLEETASSPEVPGVKSAQGP
jgi:hypothetical protein